MQLNTEVSPVGVFVSWDDAAPAGVNTIVLQREIPGTPGAYQGLTFSIPLNRRDWRVWSGSGDTVASALRPAANEALTYQIIGNPGSDDFESPPVAFHTDPSRQPTVTLSGTPPTDADPGASISFTAVGVAAMGNSNPVYYRWTRVVGATRTRLTETGATLTDTFPADATGPVRYEVEAISPPGNNMIGGWRSQTHTHEVAVATVPGAIAAAPVAEVQSPTAIRVTWAAPNDAGSRPITHYQIWRGTPGMTDLTSAARLAVADLGGMLEFVDTGAPSMRGGDTGLEAVAPGGNYRYRVRAENANGPAASFSPDSNAVNTPALAPTAMIVGSPTGTINQGDEVTLDGSSSTANTGDTDINSYEWTQVDADGTELSNENHRVSLAFSGPMGRIATFTVPTQFPAGNESLHFSLTVTDDDGMDTSTIAVTVTGANDPPTTPVITVMYTPPVEGASAMVLPAGQSILPSVPAIGEVAALNSRVVLSVTASDPDTGDTVSAFNWTLVTEARGTNAVSTGHELAAFSQTLQRSSRVPASEGFAGAPAGLTLSFNAPAFVDADGMPTDLGLITNAAGETVPRTPMTPLLLYFRVVANDGDDNSELPAWVTIAVVPPPSTGSDTAAVDRAILPHVIRALERQVHNSIFQRIQQRQRADGKWK